MQLHSTHAISNPIPIQFTNLRFNIKGTYCDNMHIRFYKGGVIILVYAV